MGPNLEQALSEFKQLLGDEYVLRDDGLLKKYETATFKTSMTIPAVLKPASVAEVQECLRIANRYKTPVYAISKGKNVGYGSRVHTSDNTLILELSRLNRIVTFDEELAYVVIEPGVTQQQLYDFLQEQKSNLWMDATGSFTSHSMIGNIAERGFGHTTAADHFAHVGGMEVVLPTGELLKTGFGRFDNAKAQGLYRWGVGPYLDGLFTQSNLGVITRLTLWLTPAPEYFEKFFFTVDREDQLSDIIDTLRPLRMDGTLRSAMHIGNDYKVYSSMSQYPWSLTGGQTPLSRGVMDGIVAGADFGAWNGSGALYGNKSEVRRARKKIRRALKGKVSKIQFLSEEKFALAEKLSKPYQWLTGINLENVLKLLKPVFGLTKGVPTDDMIASTYWR
ncbi:FAD-binding oxidoreductase, partial [Pseudomaricurvus sp.]|uniref:FAD-binding oxidoreductase n=1 Tax=Pseudomaricurvus sp. TaxID=2004510 RepID=UPI003F6AE111